MLFKTSSIIKFLLKAVMYSGLVAIIYFYQIIEVQNKYAEKLTNIANSEKIKENGIKPPIMTLCISPKAKQEGLDKYNMDKAVLNEPNPTQKNTLVKLNKTLENFFLEATFKLNVDFWLHMIWWEYNVEGWKEVKKKLTVGDINTQKVCKRKLFSNYSY